MKVIVGLGNPEDKYANTRHNLGFDIVDELRRKFNKESWRIDDKFKSEVCRLSEDVWLLRPQTYMNNSGMAVARFANYFNILAEDILIVHDELDLPLGQIKIRLGGAAAGHHGVESVIEALGTDKFIRLRCGIGNIRSQSSEHGGQHFQAEHYVLEPFLPTEHHDVKKMIKQAMKALEVYLDKGLEKAQNQFN